MQKFRGDFFGNFENDSNRNVSINKWLITELISKIKKQEKVDLNYDSVECTLRNYKSIKGKTNTKENFLI